MESFDVSIRARVPILGMQNGQPSTPVNVSQPGLARHGLSSLGLWHSTAHLASSGTISDLYACPRFILGLLLSWPTRLPCAKTFNIFLWVVTPFFYFLNPWISYFLDSLSYHCHFLTGCSPIFKTPSNILLFSRSLHLLFVWFFSLTSTLNSLCDLINAFFKLQY